MNIPDNYSQWESQEWRKEKWLKLRPQCARCRQHIQDEDCYEFDGNLICPDCIEEYIDEHYKRKTEDFID